MKICALVTLLHYGTLSLSLKRSKYFSQLFSTPIDTLKKENLLNCLKVVFKVNFKTVQKGFWRKETYCASPNKVFRTSAGCTRLF